jgi:hypothetical protein
MQWKNLTKKSVGLTALVVYLLSAGISYAVFTSVLPESVGPNRFAGLISPLAPGAQEGKVQVDANAPKTEACPLNGKFFTVAERQAWEERTPLAVMIENHVDARPQSGLTDSDVVFEAVAEGGITRFMAMVYCDAQAEDVILAPIRSARTYFIDWASSYQKPLYVHVGGANIPGPSDALGQLNDYGWTNTNDLNQFSIGFPTFARNYNRIELTNGQQLATEHTMETSSERLWKYAKENRQITAWQGKDDFTPWQFVDDAPESERGEAGAITYNFWSGYDDFAVQWSYNPQENTYARINGGQPHTDLNNGEQIKAKNVVVLFSPEKGPINENKHLLYETTGTGEALIFQNGQVVEAKWSKPTRTTALTFSVGGKPVEFVRGQIWISVMDPSSEVSY